MDRRFIKMEPADEKLPLDPNIKYTYDEVELDFGEDPTTIFVEAMKEVYHSSKILEFYYVYEDGDTYLGYIVERDKTATPFILNFVSNSKEQYYEFIRFDSQYKLNVLEKASFNFKRAYRIVQEKEK